MLEAEGAPQSISEANHESHCETRRTWGGLQVTPRGFGAGFGKSASNPKMNPTLSNLGAAPSLRSRGLTRKRKNPDLTNLMLVLRQGSWQDQKETLGSAWGFAQRRLRVGDKPATRALMVHQGAR